MATVSAGYQCCEPKTVLCADMLAMEPVSVWFNVTRTCLKQDRQKAHGRNQIEAEEVQYRRYLLVHVQSASKVKGRPYIPDEAAAIPAGCHDSVLGR